MAAVGEADLGEQRGGLLEGFLLARPAHLPRSEGDVLQRRHLREEIELLEYHAGFLADQPNLRAAGLHADAVDDEIAAVDLLQRVDAAQQCRLAGTGGADEHHHFAGLDGEIHLAKSEEHTSELQSLMRISYAVFCLNNKLAPYTPQNSIT